MAEKRTGVISVIGIDVGKNSFHVCRPRRAWGNSAAPVMPSCL
jgi:hypothetical protein